MDYSREGIEKKEELLDSASPEIEKRVWVMALRAVLVLLICGLVIGIFGTAGVVNGIIANAPDISEISIAPSGFATFIYDSEGNQLQKLTSSDSNRTAVSIDNVPVYMQHAVVAIEDLRFYQHNGVDARGILRALVVGLKNHFQFTEGASTITQQLLKNNVFTTWTTEKTLVDRVKRKFQEQYLAVKLEEKLTSELGSKEAAKSRILENYLNTINLGAGTYGVEAASKKYFNKDVWNLTLSEATVIAGITQNPSKYNPITHPDYNKERRTKVLTRMVEQGYITQADMDEAEADNVYDRIAAAQEAEAGISTVYTYFVDELTKQVVNDLMDQKGYTENQAYQLLYSGGLRIYTTQDQSIQSICDTEYADPANFPDGTQYSMDWALSIQKSDGSTVNYSKEMLKKFYQENMDPNFDLLFDSEEEGQSYIDDYKTHVVGSGDKIIAERTDFSPEPQSSIVIIDQTTGYVKAIEGGRGAKTASLTLNRATDTLRQPGSTFKILSTYAPALSSGEKTLSTIYADEPYNYVNGRPVKDASNTYQGDMTIREAIIQSINVIAVKCITDITPQVAFDQLLKFGFTTLSQTNDIYQPLALGGIYNGVSNLQLTAAYAAIANGGIYTKPIFYTKILDQDGNIIIDNTPETSRALDEDTSYLLTSAMEDVVTRGTGQNLQLDTKMPVAGKTGTTTSYNDLWFVGYTPYYTCGIWSGYDTNEKLPDEGIFRNYHQILWQKIMSRISANETIKQFEKPTDVVSAKICNESGLLATKYCTDTRTEYYLPDTAPTAYCTIHGNTYYGYGSEYSRNSSEYDTAEEDTAGNDAAGNTANYGEGTGTASSKASTAGTIETENTGAAASSKSSTSNTTTSSASDTAEETAADEEAATGTATENTTGNTAGNITGTAAENTAGTGG